MTELPVTQELRECPFCGGRAGLGERSYKTPRKSGVQHGHTANCMNPSCLAVVAGLESFDTPAEAIAAWNTRAESPLLQEAVEALHEAAERAGCYAAEAKLSGSGGWAKRWGDALQEASAAMFKCAAVLTRLRAATPAQEPQP